MRYRRAFAPGGSFFFTLVTEGRRPLLQSADAVATLRQAFRAVRLSRPFGMDAVVVLPDHLHCIWSLPEGDHDFATRWRLIKTWFTKHCDPAFRSHPDASRQARGEQAVWQHRYWEHRLRDEGDYARHVDYIQFNPVKHGYVAAAWDWPYSSFRRHVKAGVYPADWGAGGVDLAGVGGE
ncbi:MAG: transposase [Chromatiales bacterium]|nr:transposase [Chromatiales bacterium]